MIVANAFLARGTLKATPESEFDKSPAQITSMCHESEQA